MTGGQADRLGYSQRTGGQIDRLSVERCRDGQMSSSAATVVADQVDVRVVVDPVDIHVHEQHLLHRHTSDLDV
jgi:hypothetical protein